MNGHSYHIELINALGEVVWKDDLSDNTIIPTDHFASGVYFIKVGNTTETEVKKFIKH